MKYRFLQCAVLALLIVLCPAASQTLAESVQAPQYRALLIACDEFVDAPNMAPIGENNLRLMESMLEKDTRGFAVTRQYGITASAEMLAHAIAWAFRDAGPDDVSLLYLCTHGAFETVHNNPTGELLLSDGAIEERITAQQLNEMLDHVPGTKVLLVDACNSGALIGKGVSPKVGSARIARTFQSDDYKVLTSSGASEASWYMNPTLEHAPPGSSYFTTAMAVGAGLLGAYAADANRDGAITLSEMYDYLWGNQASSTVQMYPQDDDFPLLVYDADKTDVTHGELTGFVFSAGALDPADPTLQFSYTATVPTRVAYRITYWADGEWAWQYGQTLHEPGEGDDGSLSAGRKQVSLALGGLLPEGWAYAMIHVMTLGDPANGRQPLIYTSRVFTAQQDGGDPALYLSTRAQWTPRQSSELEIFVGHTVPCTLTVTVYDAEGGLVRRLMTSRMSRPQGLTPEGSLLYWNGLDQAGNAVAPGLYRITVAALVGMETHSSSRLVLVR